MYRKGKFRSGLNYVIFLNSFTYLKRPQKTEFNDGIFLRIFGVESGIGADFIDSITFKLRLFNISKFLKATY